MQGKSVNVYVCPTVIVTPLNGEVIVSTSPVDEDNIVKPGDNWVKPAIVPSNFNVL